MASNTALNKCIAGADLNDTTINSISLLVDYCNQIYHTRLLPAGNFSFSSGSVVGSIAGNLSLISVLSVHSTYMNLLGILQPIATSIHRLGLVQIRFAFDEESDSITSISNVTFTIWSTLPSA